MRKERAKRSIKVFCETYLGPHFSAPWGEHHADLFECIDRKQSAKRIVRAEPRKFGKTTVIGLGLPLQKLAFREKNFILMIGEAATTAESNLSSITDEVENNELLLEDFPHLAPARDMKGQLVKWTDRQLVFASGATIVAKGMGARMRGLKRKRFRPDLAILDDPQSPETADTVKKRKRHNNWFGGTFMGLGAASWDIYVIGNLIHHEGLVAVLLRSNVWDGKVFKARNKPPKPGYPYRIGNSKSDGSPLWPEVWSEEKLRDYQNDPLVGSLNFAREMDNEPQSDSDKKFFPEQFAYFDFIKEQCLPNYDAIATFIDPAGGQKPNEVKAGKKDFAAVVTVGRLREGGKLQVLDVRMTRDLPDKQIDLLLDVYEEFRATRVGAEENIFKNLLKSNIETRGKERKLYPPVEAIHQTQNKVTRILSIQPPVESKTIEFARHLLKTCPEYFTHFDEFPGEHDDGPDATEGAIKLLEAPRFQWRPL